MVLIFLDSVLNISTFYIRELL